MADQRIQYTEYMVGAGHPTKADTLNRHANVEHNADGTHKMTGGAAGVLYYHDGTKLVALPAGATTKILVGGGAGAPVWTEATGSGAPVRQTSPTLVTPALGTPASGDLRNCTPASTSNKGVVALATNAEAIAGTDTAKAVTSDDLRYVLDYLADLITAGLAHAIDGTGVLGKEIENIRLRVLMTGQVTITNANTGQPHWLMTTALTSNVTLSRNLPNANYTVFVEVEDADDKDRVGEIKISSKAINGFTITVTGNTNNIDLRWTVVDPNFWTR